VHDPVREDANVRFLECPDRITAFHAARKEGVDRPRELLHGGIIVAGANVHGTQSQGASDFARSNQARLVNDMLLRLVRHMRHADAIVADALDRTDRTKGEAPRLFAHIAAVEHLWYARIHERAPDHSVWPALEVPAARDLAARQADLFEALVRDADAEALGREVAYRNSAGRDFRNTVADMVLHTALHGEHHRGQIARIMGAAGVEPPYTDYIQFARKDQ
jgi:uncharacterized damage-inducible protein DinB